MEDADADVVGERGHWAWCFFIQRFVLGWVLGRPLFCDGREAHCSSMPPWTEVHSTIPSSEFVNQNMGS